jgi:hypothetical protein
VVAHTHISDSDHHQQSAWEEKDLVQGAAAVGGVAGAAAVVLQGRVMTFPVACPML